MGMKASRAPLNFGFAPDSFSGNAPSFCPCMFYLFLKIRFIQDKRTEPTQRQRAGKRA